jgi:hypothetical protein
MDPAPHPDLSRIPTLPIGSRGPYRVEPGDDVHYLVDRAGHQHGAPYETAALARAVADAMNAAEGHVGVSP